MPNQTGNANVKSPEVPGSESSGPFLGGAAGGDENRDRERAESVHRIDGTECIVCTVHLSHPDLALARTIRETPDVRVEPNYQTNGGQRRLLIFSVDTDTPEAFERVLGQDHTVADAMVVEYGAGSLVYRTRLTDAALPITPILGQLGVRIRELVGTSVGWTLQAQFPSRGAFSTFRRFCATNGVDFRVEKLSWGDDDVGGGDERLTPCQWETLCTAYESGYFDVPRQISQAELADELGISSSAVSQRLRRTLSKLLEERISSTED